MDIFDAGKVISQTEGSIVLLEDLLLQQRRILSLQKDLKVLLEAASEHDPLDHEYREISRQIKEVSERLQNLLPPKIEGDFKAGDLLPLLAANPGASLFSLVSIHCGTPQVASQISVSADGNEILIF